MTVKLHICVCEQESTAVAMTVVMPTGNVLPLDGLEKTIGVLHPPLAVTVKKTEVPPALVAVVTMFEGQLICSGVPAALASAGNNINEATTTSGRSGFFIGIPELNGEKPADDPFRRAFCIVPDWQAVSHRHDKGADICTA